MKTIQKSLKFKQSQFDYLRTNTIFAQVTPSTESPVSIIRLSGKNFIAELISIFKIPLSLPLKSRHAYYTSLFDQENLIDDVILIFLPGPHSLTGEDIVEIQFHGSLYLQKKLLSLLSEKFEIAYPGEFSFRALKNNKLSLDQIESIHQTIKSQNEFQHKAAKSLWLSGSHSFDEIRKLVKKIWVYIETNIDFVEDVHESFDQVIVQFLSELDEKLNLIEDYLHKNALYDYVPKILLFGNPNVGKSSLFNKLVKADTAIVFDQPGTTRDLLSKKLYFNEHLAVELMDSAGLRNASDPIEKIGIQKLLHILPQVELSIFILDATLDIKNQLDHLFQFNLNHSLKHFLNEKTFIVINKCDLITDPILLKNSLENLLDFKPLVYFTSTKNDMGIKELEAALITQVQFFYEHIQTHNLTQNEKIRLEELRKILNHLHTYQSPLPLELLAEEVRSLLHVLDHVMDPIEHEELLTDIFSQFCIGK